MMIWTSVWITNWDSQKNAPLVGKLSSRLLDTVESTAQGMDIAASICRAILTYILASFGFAD